MVAVVSGNGLGLFNSSNNTLHGSGQNRLGQAAGESYVNMTTGNLVLRFLDEQISGAGLDVTALRTYNSLGNATDGDGDNWRWGGERKVSLTTGTVNTAGSTVSRTTGDGYSATYNWNAASNRYESSEGDGAADFITWNASTNEWTWVDGSDLVADSYDASGRLLSQQDRHGNKLLYGYDGDGRLASVEDWGSKQKIVFTYAPLAADPTLTRLQRLDTYSLNVDASGWPTGTLGGMVTQVTYDYDNLGRLTSVATDLTPGTDNSTADGKVYITSYTYELNSLRISSVTQSDGTQATFRYHADGRVQRVEDSQGVQTFNYSTDTSSVTNGVGKIWIYKYDNEGKLISTQTPSVNGQPIVTSYAYDPKGNLIEKIDGQGNKVTYGYDANDNNILERDALGNTITRTYDANNRLLTETRYIKPDPDGAGNQTATEPVTQRYVYDAKGRLRFLVSAQGRVTEYRYTNLTNGSNQVNGVLEKAIDYAGGFYDVSSLTPTSELSESEMTSWIGTQRKDLAEVTQNYYDWRGNLKTVIQFSQLDSNGSGHPIFDIGAIVTEYVYSEHGQLLQTIARRGQNRSLSLLQSSIVYDGMGRQLSVMSQGATQTYAYNGANRTLSVSNAAGLTTVSTYDSMGRVVRVEGGGRKAYQYYDQAGRLVMTQNSAGNREYLFYDALGRIQFSVDALGTVTENQYDKNNRVSSQTTFDNVATTAAWFNGSTVAKTTLTKGSSASGADVITNSSKDRSVQFHYDQAGRLIREVNQEGVSTIYAYNGLSQRIQSSLNNSFGPTVRNFYDKDGILIGTLDQEGYLRENTYDSAGRLVQAKRYENITPAGLHASGSFAELKASVFSASLTSYFFYNAQGRVVGAVDEKGFFTETVYYEANSTIQVRTYKTPVDVLTTDTHLTIRSRAGIAVVTETKFDEFTRINREVARDGTLTNYEYDAAGRVARTIVGQGQTESDGTSSQRAIRNRYNVFGELIGQVSGVGEALLGNAPTAEAINQAIASHGEQRVYDAAGRVAQTIDANNKKTVYYYDAKNQLRFTMDATGAVKEFNYNSFGQVKSTRALNNSISDTSSLSGGALTQTVLNLFNALASPGFDRTTASNYDRRGLQTSYTDAEGFATSFTYNAFGQLELESRTLNGGAKVDTFYKYNKRGELISTNRDNGGLNIQTRTTYDAFGRIITTQDGKGQITRYQYDNSGRTITLVDPLNRNHTSSYDMLGRVLTRTDAAGNSTTYVYDDANRSVQVTTPEGTSVTTRTNRHGQTLKVVDAKGNETKYVYDKNGNVTQITDALNQVVAANQYDNSARLIIATDAKGVTTQLTYDDVNRVLSRTVDQTGVNIRTEYKFNSHGDTIETIDAAGTAEARTTRYEYDRKGQLTRMTTDPDGLGLRTDFSYDALGNQVLVTRGSISTPNQTMTQYIFDKLGRRTAQVNAYGTLNLTTQYKYDANGNLTRKIDANGNSTWYVYDASNRQTHSINQLGEVNETRYDLAGNVFQTIQYAARISAATISTWANVNVVSSVTPVATVGADNLIENLYDKNGRLTQTTVDPQGLSITTKYHYDSNNNVTRKIDANGNSTWYVYDKLNHQTHSINSLGEVTETQYNALDQVIKTIQYVTRLEARIYLNWGDVASTFTPVVIDIADTVTTHEYDNNGRLVKSIVDPIDKAVTTEYIYDANDNLTRTIDANGNSTWYVYDKANRKTHSINALGEVNESRYDAIGNVTRKIQYGTRLQESIILELGDSITDLSIIATSATDNHTLYEYDGEGRLTRSVVDPDGLALTTQYRYDAYGNLARTIDANGNSTWYVYDAANRKIQSVDAMGGVAESVYDGEGNLVESISYHTALGEAVLVGLGLTDIIEKVSPTIAPLHDQHRYYIYDNADRLRYSIDAMSVVTETIYDAVGKIVNTYTHNTALTSAQGGLLKTAIANGWNTESIVAGWYPRVGDNVRSGLRAVKNGGVVLTHTPVLNWGQSTLNSGDTITVTVWFKTDASTNVSMSLLDSFGPNPGDNQAVINATGTGDWQQLTLSHTLTHDDGLVIFLNGDSGKEFVFDDLVMTSTQQGVLYKEGFESLILMDSPTTKTTFKYTEGTSYQYDNAGRLIQEVVDPGGLKIKTQYMYDAKGNLARAVDANGNSTWYISDKLNRQIYSINPLGLVIESQYDALGHKVKQIKYASAQPSILANLYDIHATIKPIVISSDDQVTEYQYDKAGRLQQSTIDPDGLSISTHYRYDTSSNLIEKIDANGNSTWYGYDAQGRLIKTIVDPTNFALTTEYRYDANGNVIHKIDAQSNSHWYIYDAANRQTHSVNALGDVKETQYDTKGQVSKTIEYATALSPTQLVGLEDGNTQLILDSSSDDSVIEYSYDANDRLLQTKIDPGGLSLKTQYRYDANGNLTRSIDANNNSTWYVYDNAGRQIQTVNALGEVSETQYDNGGRVVKTIRYATATSTAVVDRISYVQVPENAAQDQINYYTYDKADRLRFSVDALGGVTETSYTGIGQIVTTRKMHTALTTVQISSLNSLINTGANTETFFSSATATSIKTTTSYSYDKAGRLTTSVLDPSGLNITTQYKYDSLGRLSRTIDANGNSTWNIYNSAGSLFQTIDGTGAVTRYGYKNGQLIYTYKHWARIDTSQFGDVVTSISTHNTNDDQMTLYTYDKAGRLQYETSRVDYNNHITKENRYDAKGNLVEAIVYDKYLYRANTQTPLADNVLTSDEVKNQLAILGYSTTNYGNARVTRYAYDANDRLRFTIDAAGYVSENTYDGQGNIFSQTNYAVAINASSYTEDVVDALLDKSHVKNQTTSFTYDALGRLLSSTDALNHSEYNQYDTFGNKVTFTNKRGHVWTYSYDKANRLTAEFSPTVEVAIINTSNVVSSQQRQLVTRMVYDLNGNVLSRTEGILRDAATAAEDTSQARTTQYEYDKANRQTKTILPGWYDPTTRAVESSSGGVRFQRTTEVTYDAMGNAVRNKIRIGADDFIYQTKVYDQMGRVTWEIDALNQVTKYFYNALGNQELSHTYDSHIGGVKNTGTLYSKEQMESLISALPYRAVNTYYDNLGRKVEVRQERVMSNYFTNADAATNVQGNATALNRNPSVRYAYDALGNVIFTRTAITTTEYANQWSFYNNRNQKIQDVFDVKAGEGYVTAYEYDAQGNLTQQTEYASVVSIPTVYPYGPTAPITPQSHSDDRITRFTYDQLNRQTEIKRNSSYYEKDINEQYVLVTDADHLEQSTVYDEIGNITNQIDAVGNQTKTQYDALGRSIKIDMPVRTTASASKTGIDLDPFRNQVLAIPLVQLKYNAFGQQVQETRSAGDASAGTRGRGLDSGDVVLTKRYDLAGNLISAKNLSGNYTNYSYDAVGQVISELQQVSATWTAGNYNYNVEKRYEYDLLGHQTAAFDIYQESGVTKKSGKRQTYNRFGEVVADAWVWGNANNSTSISTTTIATYTYDDAGRLTYKNSVDGTTRYFYDLAGRNTRIEQQGNNLSNDGTGVRVTEYAYDKVGRVLTQRAPQFTTVAMTDELLLTNSNFIVTPTVRQTYDRWGNIISRTDPKGNLWTYTYNNNNQVTSEILPVMNLTKLNGDISVPTSSTPLSANTWAPTIIKEVHYDALGQLVEDVQKANGVASRKRYTEYNEVGQLTAYVDGTNIRTEYAYDAFGNQIASRNGVGTVTISNFDASGNEISSSVLRNQSTLGQYFSPIVGVTGSTGSFYEFTLKRFDYDQAGRRISEIDALNFSQNYRYDERGNLLQYKNQLGTIQKTTTYDHQNNKVTEVDALGNSETWTYYANGLLESHKDLGGTTTTYTYNDFGQKTTENNNSLVQKPKIYSYKENGLLSEIKENRRIYSTLNGDPNVFVDWEIKNLYDYDVNGNKIADVTVHLSSRKEWYPKGEYVYSLAHSYDKLNQLEKARSEGDLVYFAEDVNSDPNHPSNQSFAKNFSTKSMPLFTYSYDEYGNRMEGTNYAYDLEGRILRNEQRSNGSYNPNNPATYKPMYYAYDKAGRLEYVETRTSEVNSTSGFPSEPISKLIRFTYTDLNKIRTKGSWSLVRPSENLYNYYFDKNYSQYIKSTDSSESRRYDARGMLEHKAVGVYTHVYTYRADGSSLREWIRERKVSGTVDQTFIDYLKYDLMGNLESYSASVYSPYWDGDSVEYHTVKETHDIDNLAMKGGYNKIKEEVTSSDANTSPGLITLKYNSDGQLVKYQKTGSENKKQYFIYNRDGKVILKSDFLTDTETNIYANGNQIASLNSSGEDKYDFGVSGTVDEMYTSSTGYVVSSGDTLYGIAQSIWGNGSFWYLIADANGINESPLSLLTSYAGMNIEIPTVSRALHNNAYTFKPYDPVGDTAARTKYNKPPQILPPAVGEQCNKTMQIVAVVVIVVVSAVLPVVVQGIAGNVAGLTAATGSKGLIATGTSITAGTAGGSLGLMLGASFVGGMAGNAASQGLSIAFGMQEKFSVRDMFKAGFTSGFNSLTGAAVNALGEKPGITKALENAGKLEKISGNFGIGFTKGASSYIVGLGFDGAANGFNKLIGIDKPESYRDASVDAGDWLISAISAGVSNSAGTQINKEAGSSFYKNYFSNFAGGAASAIGNRIQSAHRNRTVFGYRNGQINWWDVGVDAFGNSLASSITQNLMSAEMRPKAPKFPVVMNKNDPSELEVYKAPDESFEPIIDKSISCLVNEPAVIITDYVETLKVGIRATPSTPDRMRYTIQTANLLENMRAEQNLPSTHVTESGENPTSIAAKYGVSVFRLMAANPGLNPASMQIGQPVIIPNADTEYSDAAMSGANKRFNADVVRVQKSNEMKQQRALADEPQSNEFHYDKEKLFGSGFATDNSFKGPEIVVKWVPDEEGIMINPESRFLQDSPANSASITADRPISFSGGEGKPFPLTVFNQNELHAIGKMPLTSEFDENTLLRTYKRGLEPQALLDTRELIRLHDEEENRYNNIVGGVGQFVGGTFTAIVGLASSELGIGIPILAWGTDQMHTGLNKIFHPDFDHRTVFQYSLEGIGYSRAAADRADLIGNIATSFISGPKGIKLTSASSTESLVARRAQLNTKFGRTGDLHVDISSRGVANNTLFNTPTDFLQSAKRVSGKTGYLNSPRLKRSEILSLKNELNDIGIKLEHNADYFLDKFGKNKYRGGFDYETKTIYLRRGTTKYEAFHELTHAKQFSEIGKDAYIKLGKYNRESHVFNQVIKNRYQFSHSERMDAVRYMKDLKVLFQKGYIN